MPVFAGRDKSRALVVGALPGFGGMRGLGGLRGGGVRERGGDFVRVRDVLKDAPLYAAQDAFGQAPGNRAVVEYDIECGSPSRITAWARDWTPSGCCSPWIA